MSDTRKTWARINEVLGRAKKKLHGVRKLAVNGSDITDDASKATAFNEFFTEIGHKIAEKIPNIPDINKYSTIRTSSKSIFIEQARDNEILDILMSLDHSKSTGCDEVSAMSLKKCADIIAPIITSIVNLTIFMGVYPDDLKSARVLPVHKSESLSDPSNYRPISILPMINKIFELILHRRLMHFLE